MRRIIFVCVLILLSLEPSSSQFFETGQAPFSLNWQQIKTDHYRFVFPSEIKDEAQHMANIMERAYPYLGQSLGHNSRRIPVLMDNLTTRSNGLVVWAPRRMEIVSTPAQRSYSQEWLQQLALHEGRHVAQVDKLNQGITKVLTVPFGQIASGGVTGLLPFWFLEGDAVSAETGLSAAGRGRDPYFQKEIRALLLEHETRYAYEKAYFGSYKDFIPDHYRLGYQLTAFARQKYGPGIWDNVLSHVGRHPYQLYPFYFGLKKYGKTSKIGLYNNTLDYLKSIWSEEDKKLSTTHATHINDTTTNDYISYRNPAVHPQGGFIAEKSGLADITRIVHIMPDGKEEIMFTPGYFSELDISVANEAVYWAESHPDPLWDKVTYNVIKKYDLKRKKIIRLTDNTRYFNPYVSPDGQSVAASETDVQNHYYIVVLETENGYRLNRIPTPENLFPQDIRWHPDGSTLVLTLLGEKGKSIYTVNLETETWEKLLGPTFENIFDPFMANGYLFFHASYSGIDNVYAFVPGEKKLYQVTGSRFGAYDAIIDTSDFSLVYADYASTGYRLKKMKLNPNEWTEFNDGKTYEFSLATTLAEQEKWSINETQIPDSIYPVKKYSRLLHLFNIHSWMPFYADYDQFSINDPQVYPGGQIFFQNLLNTSVGSAGFYFRDGEFYFNTKYSYQGFRPIIEYDLNLGGTQRTFGPRNVTPPPTDSRYMEQNIRAYLPMDLTRSKYASQLVPGIEGMYRRYLYYDYQDRGFNNDVWFMNYSLFYYRLLKQAHRDIRSTWGHVVQINFLNAPGAADDFGTLLRVYGALYLPGIGKHHSLRVSGSYIKYNYEDYLIPVQYNTPRGFKPERSPEQHTLSGDYAFPVAYPDLNIWRLAYFKRLRVNLFLDYSGYSRFEQIERRVELVSGQKYLAYGFDLITDVALAHVVFPFSIGIRAGYQNQTNAFFLGPLFEMDITRF
ncbi:MAG: TolB family protein [Bacteroidota bacterium]